MAIELDQHIGTPKQERARYKRIMRRITDAAQASINTGHKPVAVAIEHPEFPDQGTHYIVKVRKQNPEKYFVHVPGEKPMNEPAVQLRKTPDGIAAIDDLEVSLMEDGR